LPLQGNITYSDLANTLPYSNWIVIKRLTGEQLWAALENAVSALDHPYGRFVQVRACLLACVFACLLAKQDDWLAGRWVCGAVQLPACPGL